MIKSIKKCIDSAAIAKKTAKDYNAASRKGLLRPTFRPMTTDGAGKSSRPTATDRVGNTAQIITTDGTGKSSRPTATDRAGNTAQLMTTDRAGKSARPTATDRVGKPSRFRKTGLLILSAVLAAAMTACSTGEPSIDPSYSTDSSDFEDCGNVIADQFIYAGHTYTIYDEGLTWEDANAFCESMADTHLVTITSEEEQIVLEEHVHKGRRNSYWLGGFKNNEGGWSWVTNEHWNYTAWCAEQPDNCYSKEDRVMIYRIDSPNGGRAKYWNDLNESGTCGKEEFFGLENMGYIAETDYELSAAGTDRGSENSSDEEDNGRQSDQSSSVREDSLEGRAVYEDSSSVSSSGSGKNSGVSNGNSGSCRGTESVAESSSSSSSSSGSGKSSSGYSEDSSCRGNRENGSSAGSCGNQRSDSTCESKNNGQRSDSEGSCLLKMSFDKDLREDGSGTRVEGYGDINFTSGVLGQALEIDGSGDYLSLGNSFSLKELDFTLNLWVRPSEENEDRSDAALFAKYENNHYGPYDFYLSHDRMAVWLSDGKGGHKEYVSETVLPSETWSMITFTFDHEEDLLKMYVNGKKTDEFSTIDIIDSLDQVTIGRQALMFKPYEDLEYIGAIDELLLVTECYGYV